MNILFFLTPKSEVAYINCDDTLSEALEKMESHHYAAVPLLNHQGKYMGTLTEGDLLWGLKSLYDSQKDTRRIRITEIPRRQDNQPVLADAAMEDLVLVEPEDFTLTAEMISEVFADSAVPDAAVMQIQNHFTEEFSDKPPVVKNLVNEKAIEKNNKEKKEIRLLEEVATLKQELQDTRQENEEKTEQIETLVKMEAPVDPEEAKNWAEVFLRMKPDKAEQVKFETIDGQKYLMIPMEEHEHINLNGVEK